MQILKYPIFLIASAAITAALVTPITSISNLIWLGMSEMQPNLFIWLKVILFDLFSLGLPLIFVFAIGFAIAFSVAALIAKVFKVKNEHLYGLAGGVAVGVALILMVELLFKTHPIAGNRTLFGQILHIVAGYIGGLSYFNLMQKDFTAKSVIRFLACLPLILILSITTSWIFDPATAAESFGFNFSEISDLGRNTLIRDMTAFFMANAIFYLLGIITLNPTWFFASGTIYASAFVFNLMAINFYGTSQNEALIAEAIFTFCSFGLGFWLFRRGKVKN